MDQRAKALAALAAQRWRVALSLTIAMMLIYRKTRETESSPLQR